MVGEVAHLQRPARVALHPEEEPARTDPHLYEDEYSLQPALKDLLVEE